MPAALAMRSTLRSAYEEPSASSASVACNTAAWTCARLAVGGPSRCATGEGVGGSCIPMRPTIPPAPSVDGLSTCDLTLCQTGLAGSAPMSNLLDLTAQGDVPGRAPARRVRHVVPAAEGQGPRAAA